VEVTFCGTRGSVPVPEREFDTFGGNTSCVMLAFDNGRIALLDAGTGIRRAGRLIGERGIAQFDNLLIGLSHTHWDHIQGFPFFAPAYDPRRRLTLALSGHAGQTADLESVFTTQMQQEFFPVPLTRMGAKIAFWQPEQENITMASGVLIRTERHGHPGGAHGYRITEGEKTVVYCTDVEHGERIDPGVVALARGADLLIHDAQYTPAELKAKRGWGHSSWEQAIEVALEARVGQLALFHHDPEHDDAFLLDVERECQRLFSNAFLAREGQSVLLAARAASRRV
jgi:phosphoribosyl 1,2-cyclic phosphodiesterase